ncbi:MAG: TonB-dependent receptor [Verrucomicrobiota bacterium]|nr:TonB-dependent receptor [Verrucomicrobiota bacterium]
MVTAQRFPVADADTPRAVEVLTAERMAATAAPNVSEALRAIAGSLSYKGVGPEGVSFGGMNSQFSIRGMRNGELVLLNGLPIQSAASGGYNLDALPLGSLDRVEVLKGAGSTLYGADALSGAINVITRKRENEKPFRFSLEAGEHETLKVAGAWFGKDVDVNADYRHLGGMERISQSFGGNYHYDTGPLDRLGVGVNAKLWEDVYLDVLGGGCNVDFRKVSDSGELLETLDQRSYWNFTDARLEREHYNIKAFFGFAQMDCERWGSKSPDFRNVDLQSGLKGDFRYSLGIMEQTIGADYMFRAADYNQQYGYHHRNDVAPVTEIKLTPWAPLVIIVGAREQFVLADAGGKDYDRFLPSAGLNLRLAEGLHAFADSGKAFRAPTFNQMRYQSDFLVGNPDLEPEEGWTHEAGLKLDTNWTRARAALFYMDYSDKIVIDNRQQPSAYVNADTFTSLGLDWDVSVQPFAASGWEVLAQVGVTISGYWADPNAETADGDRYHPGDRFQIAPNLSYEAAKWRGVVGVAIAACRENDLSDYATVNMSLRVACLSGWIKASVNNLFDETVETGGNLTPTASARYAYYGTPRIVSAGYEIAF